MVLSNICQYTGVIVYSPNTVHLNTMTCCFYDCYFTSLIFCTLEPRLQFKSIWRSHFRMIGIHLITKHYINRCKHKYFLPWSSQSLRNYVTRGCFSIRSCNSNNRHVSTWEPIYEVCEDCSYSVIPKPEWIIKSNKFFKLCYHMK